MKVVLLVACSLFLSIITYGQETVEEYTLGVMSANGFDFPIEGTIAFSDSLFAVSLPQGETIKKIVNRPDASTIYVTDGTAIDKIVISPITGKLKGFRYDRIFVVTPDQRFSSTPGNVFYYCKKTQH